ncbi:tetratricopeptide repeat protein, partial [Dactylosporangium sp. NPDC051485]|uniref:ATP-binding protein n=1 Tax=Dactylosporangium sp. NPDC051485 TaxID=3154846 RepID=UPI00341D9D56
VAAGERRIEAALLHADLALRLRTPERAVPVLWDMAAAEPLHERLHARLILALAGCGEQAAALNVFHSFRERLDEQLGITPSEEIREAHLRVLRQQLPVARVPAGPTPESPAPAQLPAGTPAYVGRGRQQQKLDEALSPGRADGTRVVVVVGAPGTGKTALAVHWAHARRDAFPDGQLFVNLRGYSMLPPLRPIDVLGRFLRALGAPPAQVPSSEEEAAALYRTLVADRRILIVLDNARSVAQVRPLIPGGGHCRVVITSRVRLTGLVAQDDARYLGLDVLPPDEAYTLLRQTLGEDRVAAEPDAVATLARVCGLLPLALRVAAANLIAHPAVSIAQYCAELLGGDLLGGLQVEGDDRSVRSTFGLSYHALPEPARRMFRLLGLVPGVDVTAEGAAELAGSSLAAAAGLLRTLTDAHLVQEPAPGRFAMHDLLRSYAWELADAGEAQAGQQRLLDWYVSTAESAAHLRYPGEPAQVPGPAAPLDRASATRWLEQERENLVSATLHAGQAGLHRTTWRLAEALHGFLSRGRYLADALSVATAGLSAATEDGDLRAVSAAQLCLADCQWTRGYNALARNLFGQALTTAESAGWRDGQAMVLRRIAAAYQESGAMRAASEVLSRARDLTADATGTGPAEDSMNLGLICWKTGRLEEAAAHHAQAADRFRALGSEGGEAVAHTNLGIAYRALGRSKDAIRVIAGALEVHRSTGNRTSETVALSCLSAAHCDLGEHATGLRLAREALRGAQRIDDRRLQANAFFSLATAQLGGHDLAGAAESYRTALGLAGIVHDRFPQVSALVGLATVQLRGGDAHEALATADEAMRLAREAELPVLAASARNVVAGSRVRLGRAQLAVRDATEALQQHRVTGHRPGEARSHLVLGAAYSALGRPAAAFGHLRRSLLLCRQMGVPPFGDAGRVAR